MVKSVLSRGTGEEPRAEYLRELELFARSSHEHVVRLLGVCHEREPLCFVTEYCDWVCAFLFYFRLLPELHAMIRIIY